MPEKPLVTSELMTCLLISSLRQSWGNTNNLVINSVATDFKGTVAILKSNCIPDSGLCTLCPYCWVRVSSWSEGGMVEDTKGKYQWGKFKEIVCYVGQSFYIFVFWGNKDCGRTAVDTLQHGDSSAQRKLVVFNAELMRDWSPFLLIEEEKNNFCHQIRLQWLYFTIYLFGVILIVHEVTLIKWVSRLWDIQPIVREPCWVWFFLYVYFSC